MKIKTNDIETNYVIEGDGPWLVMSHSLASNLTMWDTQAKLLARTFKVVRYDTRGHGDSDAPAGTRRESGASDSWSFHQFRDHDTSAEVPAIANDSGDAGTVQPIRLHRYSVRVKRRTPMRHRRHSST